MGVRRGRLLPSVMIGGVLATGVAFGVGTASAAVANCTGVDGVHYSILTVAKVKTDGTRCVDPATGAELTSDELAALKTLGAIGQYVAPTTDPVVPSTTPLPGANPTPSPTTSPADQAAAAKAAADKAAADQAAAKAAADKAAADKAAADRAAAAQAAAAAAAAKPVVLPADQALNGSALSVDPTALGGAPVGSGFFGLGTYNPGLLLAAPFGSPLRNLANTDPASAVTTASQVQAMAFDGLPEGVGVPAVLGVLILAGLGGVAVRHRILTGSRAGETDEDRTEP